MSITTAKHHKGIPLQHSPEGGEHSGPVGPQHASSGRPDKGFLGFDANGGAPMNHMYGYGYGHGRPDPFNDIDHHKLMTQGLSREAAMAEAQQLWRENKTINFRGQIVPKNNFSQREIRQHAAATAAAHAGKAEASKGNTSDTGKAGASKVGMSEDEIKNAFKGDATPSAPESAPSAPESAPSAPESAPSAPESAPAQGLASTYPVDPSTVRQPVAPVSDGKGAKDFQGNPASDSRPPVGTPAEMRQMSRDAANGRTVKTGGTTGLTPSADGGRPTQAADFRRTITSKYGTGSNVTRQPGQAPGTVTDSMGRAVPAQQWNQDQADVQATKAGGAAGETAGDNFYNPASIRQSASTPTVTTSAPSSTGPAPADSISNAMGNSAPPAPAGSLGSSMDSGLTTAGTGMSPSSIRQSAMGAPAPTPTPGGFTGDVGEAAARAASQQSKQDDLDAQESQRQAMNLLDSMKGPTFRQTPTPTTGMSSTSIRQSVKGAPAATVAQSPMDPDQKALADAKKKIKEADPEEDPDDVIEREAQGEE